MRARLPAPEREIIEEIRPLLSVPLPWLYTLPAPKDGAAVLRVLGEIPPAEILSLLSLSQCQDECPAWEREILNGVRARGSWREKDRQKIQFYRQLYKGEKTPSPAALNKALDWWARAEEFGAGYLKAIRAYHEVFFAEEETRIRPVLTEALVRAQDMAGRLSVLDLLEELSQGLRYTEQPQVAKLVLAPSFWGTPLVIFGQIDQDKQIWLFGGRPAEVSLIPGEAVPDKMLRALKALSDPTRLRILRYLAEEKLSPTQLAKRLRLRAPTVVHHLRILRLAGLVQLTMDEDEEIRTYAVRPEAAATVFATLRDFLDHDSSR